MGNERAEELIRRYLEGTAPAEEEALLESWYIAAAQDQPVMCAVPDFARIQDEILQPLRAEQLAQPKVKCPIRFWPRAAAAAAVLLIASVGSVLITHKKSPPLVVQHQPLKDDISPAGTRATLTLLDGQTIPVDSAGNRVLTRQDNATISSLGGQLIYSANQPDRPVPSGSLAYNTLTTKPGEHYSLVLPDGTKVWLNAASSITYPVVFDGNERKVKVTGEVYFEIVHNARQPFRIAVKDQIVEDIGTHLNINAYDDEPVINTTLLEGSIRVTKCSASVVLTQGQEATIRPKDRSFQLRQVDADQAIAWKKGYFYFDRVDIRTMMRQLARWYNVKVVYKGDIPKRTFKGKLYRNIHASEALQILSYFGAQFQIDDKTIMVTF